MTCWCSRTSAPLSRTNRLKQANLRAAYALLVDQPLRVPVLRVGEEAGLGRVGVREPLVGKDAICRARTATRASARHERAGRLCVWSEARLVRVRRSVPAQFESAHGPRAQFESRSPLSALMITALECSAIVNIAALVIAAVKCCAMIIVITALRLGLLGLVEQDGRELRLLRSFALPIRAAPQRIALLLRQRLCAARGI